MNSKISKGIGLFLVLLCLPICGDTEERWPPLAFVDGFSVCSPMTGEEIEGLSRIALALSRLKKRNEYSGLNVPPSECLILINDPINQEMPEICRKHSGCMLPQCANRWIDLPRIYKAPARDPSVGYGGTVTFGKHVYVNRAGSKEGSYIALLAHEYAHAVTGWPDDPYVCKGLSIKEVRAQGLEAVCRMKILTYTIKNET